MKESIKFGGKDYALVPARLKKFREANPRASITSKATRFDDGSMEFVTYILTDKADEFSADADGHATYSAEELKQPKSKEKLETISVGRALAKLGYLNDGQIATTEEMEEFEKFKTDRKKESIEDAVSRIGATKDIDELRNVFVSLGELMAEPDVISAKDRQKEKLGESN